MSSGNGTPGQGVPYRFAILPLKQMIVDAYQRPLTTFVERIEQNYDPALVGTLCVSERSKSRYALIDGQTRAEGMKRVGETEAPCIVYEKLTLAEEARLFAKFQTERRGMTSASRFKAQVIAQDETAVAIDRVLSEHGFVIDANPATNAIRAVAAVEFVFRGTFDRRYKGGAFTDPGLLGDTLEIIREAWPRLPDTAKSAPMIRGLGWYLARTADGERRTDSDVIDLDRLVDRLAKVTPSDLAKRAEALREGRGMGGKSPAYFAEAIEAQYRKR